MLSFLFFYIQFQYISRLRESEINFVFCERVLYVCTAPEQKTKSANNGKDSMSLPLFQSLRVQQVAPTVSPVVSVGASALKCRGLHRRPAPFAREAKRFIYFYLARFSRFIDSLQVSLHCMRLKPLRQKYYIQGHKQEFLKKSVQAHQKAFPYLLHQAYERFEKKY